MSALSNRRYLKGVLNISVRENVTSHFTSSEVPLDSLEVEVDDDVVEKLTILEALQVLGCHSNAAFGGGRRVLDQPGGKNFSNKLLIENVTSASKNTILFANQDISILTYKLNLNFTAFMETSTT